MSHEVMALNGADQVRQELRAAARAALRGSGYAALGYINCEVQDGGIVLEGHVPTYHLKQMAQAFVRRAIERVRVDNRLAVRRPGDLKRPAS